jgi:NAD-reducing hydrogenase small subunit
MTGMAAGVKPTLATCALTGCFGCHMSLLDIDERILELINLVDLDVSPFDDKKCFDGQVDVGFIEGGCSNEYNVRELKDFRAHCKILVAVGSCAITGGVPAMRNNISLRECLEAVYLHGVSLRCCSTGSIPPTRW